MILEIAGPPRSGKTLIASAVEYELRRFNIESLHFHGGGRFVDHRPKNSPSFNHLVFMRCISRLLSEGDGSGGAKCLIMDRGILDAAVYSKALWENGEISWDDYSAIDRYVRLPIIGELKLHIVVLDPDDTGNSDYHPHSKIRHRRDVFRRMLAADFKTAEEMYPTLHVQKVRVPSAMVHLKEKAELIANEIVVSMLSQ